MNNERLDGYENSSLDDVVDRLDRIIKLMPNKLNESELELLYEALEHYKMFINSSLEDNIKIARIEQVRQKLLGNL